MTASDRWHTIAQVKARAGRRALGVGSNVGRGAPLAALVLCACGGDASELPLLRSAEPVPRDRAAGLALGFVHSCLLDAPGAEPLCWGENIVGQAQPPLGARYVSISAGFMHACGLREDGGVECWGLGTYGQLDVPRGVEFAAVTAGSTYTCGLRAADGRALCWTEQRTASGERPPVFDSPAQSFVRLSAGGAHACGIRAEDGSIFCWGDDRDGRLDAPSGTFSAVSAGGAHTCALEAGSGRISCWGLNEDGQAAPPALDGYRAVASGGGHSCAVRADRGVDCWGRSSTAPMVAPENVRADAIGAGLGHSCAHDSASETIECWGDNALGSAEPPPRGAIPERVPPEQLTHVRVFNASDSTFESASISAGGLILYGVLEARSYSRYQPITERIYSCSGASATVAGEPYSVPDCDFIGPPPEPTGRYTFRLTPAPEVRPGYLSLEIERDE